MHHTPVLVPKIADAGTDLMLSGHTHNGQLWPFNYLSDRTYGYNSGMNQVTDRMKLIISNGYGFWGPPMRIGADPQLVLLTIHH
jgi:uncharacterized protein